MASALNRIVISIHLEGHQNSLQDFPPRAEGLPSDKTRVIVTSPFGAEFHELTPKLIGTITLEKLKEIEWYYETYPILDFFDNRRATAAERLLRQHAGELLTEFITSTVLPDQYRGNRIVLQVSSSSVEDRNEQDVSQFFWETLEDTSIWNEVLGFLPTSVSVVRAHDTSNSECLQDVSRANQTFSKILVLTARLTGKEDIPHRLITRTINELAAKAKESQPNIEVGFVRPGTIAALEEALQRYQPDLLHLDLHGSLDADGRAILYFITFDSNLRVKPDPVRVDALVEVLIKYKVRAVVINACRSAANNDNSSNLAQQLVEAGISAAVGMRFNVLSRSVETFIHCFYEHLLVQQNTVLEAMTLARSELRKDPSRGTKLGHTITLEDHIIPTLHLDTKMSKLTLQTQAIERCPRSSAADATNSLDIAVESIIGREGDMLHLETIMPMLEVPCVNIYGPVGIGKTAFMHDLVDWWSKTGLSPHKCYVNFDRRAEALNDVDLLLQSFRMDIERRRNSCCFLSGTESQCQHRLLIVLDDLDTDSWNLASDAAKVERGIRTFIRRSRNIFWIVSSRKPLPWLVRSIAVMHELTPLTFNEALTLANRLATFQMTHIDQNEAFGIRCYYEELIELCSGNPLALKMMITHLNEAFRRNPSISMRAVFYSTMSLENFYLDEETILSWVENTAVISLWKSLKLEASFQDTNSSLPAERAPKCSLQRHLSGTEVFNTPPLSLMLSLGIFCGVMPDNIEPFVTTLCVQQVTDHYDLRKNLTQRRKRFLRMSNIMGKTMPDGGKAPLSSCLTCTCDVCQKLMQEAKSGHLWLSFQLNNELERWISPGGTQTYKGGPLSWQRKTRSVNPVFTFITRAFLHTLKDSVYLREDIQCALAASKRYESADWGDPVPILGTPQGMAVGRNIGDQFLNYFAYAISMKKIESWPGRKDWGASGFVVRGGQDDARRQKIAADFGASFASFAAESLQMIRERILTSEEGEAVKAGQKKPSSDWYDFVSLELNGAFQLGYTAQYRLHNALGATDVPPILAALEKDPLTVHVPDVVLKDLWCFRLKFVKFFLGLIEDIGSWSPESDIAFTKDMLDIQKRLGHKVNDYIEVDFDAPLQARYKNLLDQVSSIGLKKQRFSERIHKIEQGRNPQDPEDVLAVIKDIESLLDEEIRTSNDALAKTRVLRRLALWNTRAKNYAVAADHQQRADELLSTLDPEVVARFERKTACEMQLLQSSSSESRPYAKTEEEILREGLEKAIHRLKEIQDTRPRNKELEELEELEKIHIAQILSKSFRHKEAIEYYKEVIASRRERHPLNHEQVLTPSFALAQAYGGDKQYEEAVKRLKDLCLLKETMADMANPNRELFVYYGQLGLTLSQWSFSSRKPEMDDEAESYLKRSYTGHKKRPATEKSQIDLAIAATNLGCFYTQRWKHKDAEPYLRESLNLRLTLPRTRDEKELLKCEINLAHALSGCGKDEASQELYMKAVERSTRMFGAGDTRTLSQVSSLGILMERQGKIKVAQKLAKQHLIPLLVSGNLKILYKYQSFSFGSSFLGTLGQDHIFGLSIGPTPEASPPWSLAVRKCRDEVESYQNSEPATLDALFAARVALVKMMLLGDKITDVFGEIVKLNEAQGASLSIAQTIESGVLQLEVFSRIVKNLARELWEPKALAICSLARKSCSPKLIECLEKTAQMYSEVEDFGKALPLYKELYTATARQRGANTFETFNSLSDLGWTEFQAGDKKNAEIWLAKAAVGCASRYNRNYITARAWLRLAICQKLQGHEEKADLHEEKACQIWRDIGFLHINRVHVLIMMIEKYRNREQHSFEQIDCLYTELIGVSTALNGESHANTQEAVARRTKWREKKNLPIETAE